LYALQTASVNLRQTSFEPEQPTRVVIDRECVGQRPIGASAWSAVEGRGYDDLALDLTDEEKKENENEKSMARSLIESLGLNRAVIENAAHRRTALQDNATDS
jgi:hypothetical protein